MSKPIDLSLKSTLLFQICNNHSYKKVQAIGVFLIVSSLAVLALSVYFCAASGSFINAKVIAFSSTAIPLLAVGIIFLKMRSSLLTLLKTTDLEFNDGRQMEAWKITQEEAQSIAITRRLQLITDGANDVTSMLEFADLCNDFDSVEFFKNNMDTLFSIIDPKGNVRETLRNNLVECVADHGFAQLGKEFQTLEWRINWSFLNLLDNEKQKELLLNYLSEHDSEEDFQFMCTNYPKIALRLLPSEVLTNIDSRMPNANLLWSNWQKYQRGEEEPSEIM